MIKLALTGSQLAELYLMNAIGVPSDKLLEESQSVPYGQRMYLVDTEHGRKKLIEYAEDLHERIKVENERRLMADIFGTTWGYVHDNYYYEAVVEPLAKRKDIKKEVLKIIDGIFNKMLKYNDHAHKNKSNKRSLNLNDIDEYRHYVYAFLDYNINFSLLSEETSDAIDGGYIDIPEWMKSVVNILNRIVYSKENTPEEMVEKVKKELLFLTTNKDFISECRKSNAIEDPKENEGILIADYIDKNWDKVREDRLNEIKEEHNYDYKEMSVHVAIDDVLIKIKDSIDIAKNSTDRNVFLQLMSLIDLLSSLSHHGGPAFEYGDSSERGKVRLTEVMHRKFGDRFIPWLMASDVVEDKELKDDIQQWYKETQHKEAMDMYEKHLESSGDPNLSPGQKYNINISKDSYYQHPYYSDLEKWLAQTSKDSSYLSDFAPYMWLEEHHSKYPHLAKYIKEHSRGPQDIEDILNISSLKDSVTDSRDRRNLQIQNFIHRHPFITNEVIDDAKRFVQDFQNRNIDLMKKFNSILDVKGFYIQADILEKNIYETMGV